MRPTLVHGLRSGAEHAKGPAGPMRRDVHRTDGAHEKSGRRRAADGSDYSLSALSTTSVASASTLSSASGDSKDSAYTL
ncbi:hypothetical protein G1C96_0815 [Bifidobacterium sp. DSM 109958]|uniref:Uncharacterized protein n=1 Tax=Bifidobacterium moraviense TaxID=2675323 RepID=A0A7Y0F1D7_9BIFI|nr:hypothetical protein [Bifidobacterium sp. DSM 109958]